MTLSSGYIVLTPTQLVLADVRQLLGRLELAHGTALVVRFRLSDAERLERRIIYELCLLDDVEPEVESIIRLRRVAPVQEVVIVDNTPSEVALTEDGYVVRVVLVSHRTHEAVDEAGLADAACALLLLRTGKPDDRDIVCSVLASFR